MVHIGVSSTSKHLDSYLLKEKVYKSGSIGKN